MIQVEKLTKAFRDLRRGRVLAVDHVSFQARPGDCIYLPPGEIHREGNDGLEESEIVVVRSGSGELVVNVAGPAA